MAPQQIAAQQVARGYEAGVARSEWAPVLRLVLAIVCGIVALIFTGRTLRSLRSLLCASR